MRLALACYDAVDLRTLDAELFRKFVLGPLSSGVHPSNLQHLFWTQLRWLTAPRNLVSHVVVICSGIDMIRAATRRIVAVVQDLERAVKVRVQQDVSDAMSESMPAFEIDMSIPFRTPEAHPLPATCGVFDNPDFIPEQFSLNFGRGFTPQAAKPRLMRWRNSEFLTAAFASLKDRRPRAIPATVPARPDHGRGVNGERLGTAGANAYNLRHRETRPFSIKSGGAVESHLRTAHNYNPIGQSSVPVVAFSPISHFSIYSTDHRPKPGGLFFCEVTNGQRQERFHPQPDDQGFTGKPNAPDAFHGRYDRNGSGFK